MYVYIYMHVYVHVVPNNPSIGPVLFRYNSRAVDGDGPLPKLRYIVHAYMLKTSLRHLNGCFFFQGITTNLLYFRWPKSLNLSTYSEIQILYYYIMLYLHE